MSKLALELIEREKRERTGKLDLGNCGLVTGEAGTERVWEALGELEWLEELVLGDEWIDWETGKSTQSKNQGKANQLAALPSSLPHLGDLQSLVVSGNNIGDISHLQNLAQLQKLNLWNTQVQDIQHLQNLSQLQTLDLSRTKVQDIQHLQNLSHLQTLNLSRTKVQDIQHLQNLSQLQTLFLSGTQVQDIQHLRNLSQLQTLFLSGTDVRDIQHLRNLPQLQYLDLSFTPVQDIQHLQNLSQLQYLDLSFTKVLDIQHLQNLMHLQSLYLNGTQVQDISHLKNLSLIKSLGLSNTQVQDIQHLQELTQLQTLNLSNTKVQDIRPLRPLIANGLEPKDDNHGEGILLQGCNITNPPMRTVLRGREAILKYWTDIEKYRTGFIHNKEIKLFILGNTTAGKSSISSYLRERKYDPSNRSTQGADLRKVWEPEGKDLKVLIWDFGGQEIYHATYRLLLKGAKVALIVVDANHNKDEVRKVEIRYDGESEPKTEYQQHFRHPYWLRTIRHFAPHAKLLFVWSKLDEAQWKGKDYPFLSRKYKKQYQILEGHDEFRLSVKDVAQGKSNKARRNWENFEEHLIQTLVDEVTHVPIPAYAVPVFWLEIRKEIESRGTEHFSIPLNEFQQLYQQYGSATDDLMHILDYLQDVGAVLYSENSTVNGDSKVYLNPSSFIALLYGILNHKVLDLGGHFSFDIAKGGVLATWEKLYSKPLSDEALENVTKRLLYIMANPWFELVFEVEGKALNFVAPQYLGGEKPEAVKDMGEELAGREADFALRFSEYVPRHVIPGFVASKGKLSKKSCYWKHGILYMEAVEGESPTSVLVEYFPEQGEIRIWLGDSQRPDELKHKVFQDLRKRIKDDGCFKVVVEGEAMGFERLVEEWNKRGRDEEFLIGGRKRFGFCFGVEDKLSEGRVIAGEVGVILERLSVMEDRNEGRHQETMAAHGETQKLLKEQYDHLLTKANAILDRFKGLRDQIDNSASKIRASMKANEESARKLSVQIDDAFRGLEGMLGDGIMEVLGGIEDLDSKGETVSIWDKLHLKLPMIALMGAVVSGEIDMQTAVMGGVLASAVELDVTLKELVEGAKRSCESLGVMKR